MAFSDFVNNLALSARSIVKIAVQSRCTSLKPQKQDNAIIVMGNGPSLNKTIAECGDTLAKHPLLAVNFAANAPQFVDLKPKYYILVDPFFFSGKDAENLVHLWQNLANVSWQMTIIVPRNFADKIPADTKNNPNISIKTINCVGIEGFAALERFAFKHRLAMPRPRNVLIPAIMAAIWLGFHKIYIVGADHSWMQSIRVDENNTVVSVQPHFYKDDTKEQKRVDSEYKGYRLHQIINSFYIAFKSYHLIQRFATSQHITILNATPTSFIDAFPRQSL